MNQKNIRFLIADDHSIIRKGLVSILKSISKDLEVFSTDTIKETATILKEGSIDYLMLDISFKDKKSIELVSYAKKYNPSISILIFSMHDEIELIIRYLNEGANGYLPKNSTELEIRNALNTFLEKKSYLSQKVKDQIIDSVYLIRNENPLKKLSNREYEVSKLLIIGKSTSEISNILDLKNSTISTLKGRVFEKLNIQSVVSLVEIFNLYD